MTTRRFTPAALEAIGVPFELDGECCATEIRNRVVGSERWTHVHELIFRAPDDGKAYLVHYEVGATEHQDGIDPWHRHGDTVTAVEVAERHALVTRWVPVTDETDPGAVLAEIAAERATQDAQWGEQNHPDGTGLPVYQHSAHRYRDHADRAAASGCLAWRDVLLEEVHEALAEADPALLRAELVQVAAVAAAWAEAIDRRAEEPTR